jgi:hypothetical protein
MGQSGGRSGAHDGIETGLGKRPSGQNQTGSNSISVEDLSFMRAGRYEGTFAKWQCYSGFYPM